MNYKNIIFDMDGVLIDNSAGIFACARYAIERLGLTVPPEPILRKFVGPSLVWSLKEYAGATDEQAEEGLRLYREKYFGEKVGVRMFRLYDGVAETVKTLFARGVRLSVCSGKPQECVDYILETCGLADCFEKAVGASASARTSGKDDQLRAALLDRPALMVGDRVFDLACAQNAGIDSAFALYGFGDASDYADRRPTYFLEKPTDLLAVVGGGRQ